MSRRNLKLKKKNLLRRPSLHLQGWTTSTVVADAAANEIETETGIATGTEGERNPRFRRSRGEATSLVKIVRSGPSAVLK